MAFQFQPFSRKQKQALYWWHPGSGKEHYRLMLADGAIRSGKTVAMILSFLRWSQASFQDQDFILAGVTTGALMRNVLSPLFQMLETLALPYEYRRTAGLVRIGSNRYHLFGADKDNAQDKLQGMTAAGAFADEAALFPRSFVDQMIGRCSVAGSRIFLNCNPNGAFHYMKTDFIDRAEEIGMYRLHFTMEDNLTLSPAIRESYARSFQGVFYRQYILGEWVSAEGAVYPIWDEKENTYEETAPGMYRGMRRFCAIDYGTTNPCVFLDVRDDGHTFFIAGEYYWDSGARRRQKTDAEYADDLFAFLDGDLETLIIVDPSAASFKTELRNRGFRIQDAVNDVREGISTTATLIGNRQVKAERSRCTALQREIQSYVWDEKARLRGEERPLKERDHAMDALRYLCHTRTNRFRRMKP
ncbi:MAG: PBSX family phage terminase large subunit [Clostridia bacterium]|nr:PBSX family phage terminase large subunit [Clostridia bacterium]